MRLSSLLLGACLAAFVPMTRAAAPAAELRTLFADEWERTLRENPETASYYGDTRYDDRWPDLSPEAIAARESGDRLDYDTFEWQLQHAVERQRFREYLQPISHQGGPQTADGIAELMPFASAADYGRFLARMAALPRYIEQSIALMREGVKQGIVPARVLMARVPAQIAAQIVDEPERSPFYRPFRSMPQALPAAQDEALRERARSLIREVVVPAFRRLQREFDEYYLPHARPSIAATGLPDGRAYYDFLVRYYTTTGLSAEQIHEIGLKEVARLHAAMQALMASTGFEGSLAQFFEFLRSDPRFFRKTPAALLETYRALAKRIDPELVKVFRTLPRLPYGVRAIPDNIAPDTTAAYYQNGANDGSRPGYYYVNLYKPESRPTWEMVPLTLHEAAPGHHLQFARALEMPDAPTFRRVAYFVAYGEGWALYAEKLGYEMGLYDDPYDRFGQLTYEMWRAVRLVVDTGMHLKGWSRERAIRYFKENTAKTDQDIVNEIDRYIGTPAQALAYKIGEMKISALRERAAAALGARFDLRDFNDEVLATGSVPLAVLETHIDNWIAARRAP